MSVDLLDTELATPSQASANVPPVMSAPNVNLCAPRKHARSVMGSAHAVCRQVGLQHCASADSATVVMTAVLRHALRISMA